MKSICSERRHSQLTMSTDVKPYAEALELKLQESENDFKQTLGHEVESTLLLRQQLNELKKRLEDKENKLTEANEIIRVLRNEVLTLQHQLELQRRKCQDVIKQSGKTCHCVRQIDEVTSLGYVSPPNLFLSCTSEDNPADLPISLSDGAGRSLQQGPLRLVTVALEDCREMLGPNGVYKIPTEDGNHDEEGSNDFDQHYDSDDDENGDSDEGDNDYDPTNEGLNKVQLSCDEKAPSPEIVRESKGRRQRKSHECGGCGERFPSLSRLLVHQRTRRNGKSCEKKMVRISIHQRVHAKTTPLVDTGVEKEMAVEGSEKLEHKETLEKAQEIHQCDICGKIVKTASSLKVHKKLHTGERPHVCTHCGKTFTTLGNCQSHCRIHTQEKPYECSYCPGRFISSTVLKAHVRRHHTGEKPYSCTHCNKTFFDLTTQKGHLKTHSEDRPFQCLQCGLRCKYKATLVKHEAMHRGERVHCTHCSKTFSSNEHLKRHLRTHTGEKPYKCSVCEKSFTTLSILNNHKLRHTGERAHLCPVCGKAFARSDVLKTHQRVHTGEKPYECTACGEKFSYIQTLQSHQKREHPESLHGCFKCGDSFKTAVELNSHECVLDGNKNTLEEVNVVEASIQSQH